MKQLLCITFLSLFTYVSGVIINIPTDQLTIQEGINVSVQSDTVLVQPGTYFENLNFNGQNIVLGSLFLITQDSSYISQTVIDGSQAGRVITFENDESSDAVLVGFTIQNGYVTGTSYPENRGGGISIVGSSPTLKNLIVTDNQATAAGGISFWDNANANLYNILVKNNFSYNNSAGLHISNSNPLLTNLIIKNNHASGKSGAIGFSSCSPILKNTLIVENTANDKGGAMYLSSAACPTFINTTICNNFSPWSAIYCDSNSSPNLINSILWNNSPIEILFYNGGSISITFSDIKNGWFGQGNISNDPLFMDTGNGDYHLTWDNFPIQDATMSPCIDTGDPTSPYDPDGTIVDMGCYYFDQNESGLPVTLSSFTAIFDGSTPNLQWTTQSENNNLGWNVYRSLSENLGQANQINNVLIPGYGTTSEPTDYVFTDAYEVENNISYWYWLESTSYSGETDLFGPVTLTILIEENQTPDLPTESILQGNYPNPFNPHTMISFSIQDGESGALTIYNTRGQLLETHHYESGDHQFNWNAEQYGSGIYFYKLETENFINIKKMIMVK